jgi:hypothetical protein
VAAPAVGTASAAPAGQRPRASTDREPD